MAAALSDLYKRVTSAIIRAEAMDPESQEAIQAFREVATIEMEIATIVGPDTIEGEIARCGAVAASLSAREFVRAHELAERYLAEPLEARVRAKLQDMHAEAMLGMLSATD